MTFTRNRFMACLEGKCPRCQTGYIFKHPFYHPKFTRVHDRCPHCNVKFQSEPGFFWGAMYFSYALGVGLGIIIGVLFFLVYEEPPLVLTSSVIIGTVLVLMPVNLRISRVLFIYIAAPYRRFSPDAKNNQPESVKGDNH